MITFTDEAAARLAEGTIGLAFSSIFLMLFVYRLWQYIRNDCCVWSKQRVVQSSLVCFCLLQTMHYTLYITHYNEPEPEQLHGFICHLLSIVFLIVAYTLFITLWSDTLRCKSSSVLTAIVVLFSLTYFGLTIVEVCDIILHEHIDLDHLLSFKITFWSQAIGFVLASGAFLLYGLRAHAHMKHSEKWYHIYRRLNFVLLTCTFCAGLRVCMLLLSNETDLGLSVIPDYPFIWLALSQWIPFFGLLFVIQYVTRKSELVSISDTELWSTVIHSTHTRIDGEDDDVGLAKNLSSKSTNPRSYVTLYGGSNDSKNSGDMNESP